MVRDSPLLAICRHSSARARLLPKSVIAEAPQGWATGRACRPERSSGAGEESFRLRVSVPSGLDSLICALRQFSGSGPFRAYRCIDLVHAKPIQSSHLSLDCDRHCI